MEYKDMEGEEIPYSDYGHRTLDDFLLHHPMLNGMMQDGKWVFTAKMSERSANIQALVKGQKGKKKKGKKGPNSFARSNFSRSSYHGKPTLGQGDVRRANGSQPFNRNTQSYRSFTPGSSRPPISAPINSNFPKNPTWGSQQANSARPGPSFGWNSSSSSSSSTSHVPPFSRYSQPSNQTRKFIPTLAPARSSFNANASCSSTRPDGPQEGMRRFNTILFKCKGAATLRVFCRLYAQEFHVAFVAEELKRHFNTANLAEVINKYGNDKILVSPTPDGSVMFTDSQVLEAHTRAARDLEEKKKNSVVIEPEKKHCSIPSLKVMYDEMTEMLVDSFPEGIPVGEITSLYEKRAGVRVDPVAVFALHWNELIEKKFNSRIRIDNGKAVLTPTYIKANNLQVRTTGERKKQELVTLTDLGIVFVDDSSHEEDEEGEDECESETASLTNGVQNTKNSWRAAPSGYESMCSSVASSVQCLNVSPREMNDTVISEEVDELSERLRTVKVEADQASPRMVTITRSPLTTDQSLASKDVMTPLCAVVKKEEKEEKPVKSSRSFFSKLSSTFSSFGNSSRNGANAPPPSLPATTVKEDTTIPHVSMNPAKGEMKMPASGSYKSFSITVDSKDVYAVKVTCDSPYYRVLGSTFFTTRGAKLIQVIREEGPKGVTAVNIDFVKMVEGDKRSAVDVMKTPTPHFTLYYSFTAE